MKVFLVFGRRWVRLAIAAALVSLNAVAGTPENLNDPAVAADNWESETYEMLDAATANLTPSQREEALLEKALSEDTVPVIVKLRPAVSARDSLPERQQEIVDELGLWDGVDRSGADVKTFDEVEAVAMRADALDLVDLIDSPNVAEVYEDLAYPPALAESVPLVGSSSSRDFLGYGGQGQVVAVLDTGVDKAHPFLAGKVVSEACYSTNAPASGVTSLCPGGVSASTASGSGLSCSSSVNGCGHGTHVAGIVAGSAGGFTGVAKDARIIAIQVFSRFPAGSCGGAPCVMAYTSDIIKGLERVHALRTTYRIAAVNMSLGGGSYTRPCDNDATKPAIDALLGAGIATVIASGNNGYTNAISSPGCVSTAVTVGSTTKSDVVSSFSNSAYFLDLLAPGSAIRSSVPGGGYQSWNGTSMAAPHVAGAWAVLKSMKPTATVGEILSLLQSHGAAILDADNGLVKSRIQVDDAAAILDVGSEDEDDGGAAPLPPSVPVGRAATAITSSSFTAGWASVAGAASYRLDVSLRNDFRSYLSGYRDLSVGDATARSVTGLKPSTTYYYRLRAANDAGVSQSSAPIAVQTLPPPPNRPSLRSPTGITHSSFSITWGSVRGATGYRLDVARDSGFASYVPGLQDRDMGSATSLAVTGLSPTSTYYVRARAYNSSGSSASSSVRRVTTKMAPPPAPIASSALGVMADRFEATWTAAPGAAGYRLDLSTDSQFATYVRGYQNRSAGNRVSLKISRLAEGTTYYYRVRAYNKGGYSPSSNVMTLKTPIAPPRSPSLGYLSQVGTGWLVASWSPVPKALGYALDVATDRSFTQLVAGYRNRDAGAATSVAVTGLSPSTRYYVRARAYNAGGESASSRYRMVTTKAVPPSAPVAAAATGVYRTSFVATWDRVPGALGYRMDVSTSAQFKTFVRGYRNRAVGRGSSRRITGLKPGTTYYYRVRAYNKAGTSASSSTRIATTAE